MTAPRPSRHDVAPKDTPPERVAVIDVGSATATLALFRRGVGGSFEEVDRLTHDLGLMRLVGEDGALGCTAIAATVDAMREFARRARVFGADRVEAIATSAVRDSVDRGDLVARVRDASGLELRVISGEEEARLGVACVVDTLPLRDGLVIDLGGGSLQLGRFQRRRATYLASVPLGALRMQLRFLASDPPSGSEIVALRRHADAVLRGVPWVSDGRTPLVGIGGTVRAIAKVVRRDRSCPVGHLHGFVLTEDDVLAVVEILGRMCERRRSEVPGLKARRVGSVVAGAIVIAGVLRAAGADRLLVSVCGIRDASALEALHGPGVTRDPAVTGLRATFPHPGGEAARARSRALRLFDRWCEPALDPVWRSALGIASWIVAAGAGDAHRLLREPLQGHTHDEIIAAARLLGVLTPPVPAALRRLLSEALTG